MLGYTKTHQVYPDAPTDSQIMNLPTLTMESILQNTSVFATYNALSHSDSTDWMPFKALLLRDLANHQLDESYTFEWGAEDGEKSRWNQVMIYFTVKHWKFAKAASAFQNFALDLENPTDLIQVGIMTRWVIGRIEEMKSRFRDPHKVEQRTRSKKRRDVSHFFVSWYSPM
jgi:hypothetical protein